MAELDSKLLVAPADIISAREGNFRGTLFEDLGTRGAGGRGWCPFRGNIFRLYEGPTTRHA